MQSVEHELERLETLLGAMNKAFEALQRRHNDSILFLKKLHNRATSEDILQEGYQTRLDPDLMDELELFLAIRPDANEEEARPN